MLNKRQSTMLIDRFGEQTILEIIIILNTFKMVIQIRRSKYKFLLAIRDTPFIQLTLKEIAIKHDALWIDHQTFSMQLIV